MIESRVYARWAVFAALAVACFGQIPADVKPALDGISAEALRADVSFLASDLLEGRATPSPGLEIAAEYIASQFRRAGLKPAGDSGYFQTARLNQVEPDMTGFQVEVTGGGEPFSLKADDVAFAGSTGVNLAGMTAVKADAADKKGKVVIASMADMRRSGRRELAESGAALVIVTGFRPRSTQPRLVAPDDAERSSPLLFVRSDAIAKAAFRGGATVTVHVAAPKTKPVTLRNVAAVIPGSDPKLKDTFVLVTAHYDHIGVRPEGKGDRINNGANDDASGTASVLEIAGALAGNPAKPKRSILFVAFFGEEEGGIGSTWYGRHPLVPLAQTIGDINLEQLGRTDDPTGPKLNDATITGFDFSDLPQAFVKAGELTGIKVYKDDRRSDAFFSRSDNQMIADKGVPAHTMCVAYEFPDYHNVGDEWQKLDYDNMAKVDRMVTLGVWLLADGDKVPEWNKSLAAGLPTTEAAARLHGAVGPPPSHFPARPAPAEVGSPQKPGPQRIHMIQSRCAVRGLSRAVCRSRCVPTRPGTRGQVRHDCCDPLRTPRSHLQPPPERIPPSGFQQAEAGRVHLHLLAECRAAELYPGLPRRDETFRVVRHRL